MIGDNINKPVKHHYVPKAYLGGFTDLEGMLYAYDKKEDKWSDRKRPPKRVMTKDNLYNDMSKSKDSSERYYMETVITSGIDKLGIQVVRDIIDGVNITVEQKHCLSFFIGYMLCRSPQSLFSDYINHDKNIKSLFPEDDIMTGRNKFALLMTEKKFKPLIFGMKWSVAKIPFGEELACGENPVFTTNPLPMERELDGEDFLMNTFYFPLDKSNLLIIERPFQVCHKISFVNIEYHPVMKGLTNWVNGGSRHRTDRWVMASRKLDLSVDVIEMGLIPSECIKVVKK